MRMRLNEKTEELRLQEQKWEEAKKKYKIPDISPLRCNEPNIVPDIRIYSERKQKQFKAFLVNQNIKLNSQQEEMLFSVTPSTSVLAGAGSGKSTILSLRIYYLNIFLKIPLHHITVTTFTVKARLEFIEKLISFYERFGDNLSIKSSESVVKTFHSIAIKTYYSLGGNRKLIFGNRTPKKNKLLSYANKGEGGDISSIYISDEDVDDDVPPIDEIMNRLYKEKYCENKEFRILIDRLHISSILNTQLFDYDEEFRSKQKGYIIKYDDFIIDYMLEYWDKNHSLFFTNKVKHLISPGELLFKHDELPGGECKIRYHFHLSNIDSYIFLGCSARDVEKSETVSGSSMRIPALIRNRQKLCLMYGSANYIWVSSPEQLEELIRLNSYGRKKTVETQNVPQFSFACVGDIIQKDVRNKIWKQFSLLSQFVYSLGHSLADITEDDFFCYFSSLPDSNLTFLKAAHLFQSYLEQELYELNLISPDQIFHQLSAPNNKELKFASVEDLNSIEHLHIDEYQDISENILKFIKSLKIRHLEEQKRRGSSLSGSIVCVGDDDQTIYSWRGSSAKYITNFEKYIASPAHEEYKLETNYRSQEHILRKASICSSRIINSSHKSFFVPEGAPNNGLFETYSGVKDDNQSKFRIDYSRLLETVRSEYKAGNNIYLLYQKKSYFDFDNHPEWKAFREKVSKIKNIEHMTIHKSKGLEADTVIILGDITSPSTNPLKNAIYSWVKMGESYDDAQRDETYRLAYVAITRAKKNLHWFFDFEKSKKESNTGKISTGRLYI